MNVIVCVLLLLFVIVFDLYRNKKRVTPFTMIAFPYAVIILVNNTLAIHFGFFEVTLRTALLITISLLLFWLGSQLAKLITNYKPICTDELGQGKTSRIRIAAIKRYVFLVNSVVTIRLIMLIVRAGLRGFFSPRFEGYMLSGPMGHFLLTIYPLAPIIFYSWLTNKKHISSLVLFGWTVLLLFSTQVKYHVIGIIVLTFIFTCLEDRHYLKTGVIALGVIVVVLFAGNYMVSLFAQNSKASSSFIFGHLWKYTAGSLICDNYVFTIGVNSGIGLGHKIGSILFAFPNMFIKAFGGKPLFQGLEELPYFLVSDFGERGNVIDQFAFLYPSKGGCLEIAAYGFVIILFGFLVNWAYIRSVSKKREFTISISIILTFSCCLSFFAVYMGLIPPWEILFWSYIMRFLFSKRVLFRQVARC